MIFVTVGSRNYPFDRLFKKLDELCEEGVFKEEIFAQVGTSSYKPKNFEFVDFLPKEEFENKMQKADIVLSHGASGTIMNALSKGKKVIAVCRLEKYGEHINDHQRQNNEALAKKHFILMADPELSDLKECFEKIYEKKDGLVPWENKDPMAVVNRVDRFIRENWPPNRKRK